MARPTKRETALKRWEEIETEVMSDLPVLLKKAMARVKKMLDDESTKNSEIIRCMTLLIKLWRDLDEERLDNITEGLTETAAALERDESRRHVEEELDDFEYITGVDTGEGGVKSSYLEDKSKDADIDEDVDQIF